MHNTIITSLKINTHRHLKLHEILVSDEESLRTYRNGDYYVIQPMLPEVAVKNKTHSRDLIGEYSSGNDLMNYKQTVQLLEKNELMLEDQPETHEVKKEMIR